MFYLFYCIRRCVSHGEILTLHTGDASLTHSLRLADMCLHKAPVLFQQDADAKQKHGHTNYDDTKDDYFQHDFLLFCADCTTFAVKIVCKDRS